KFDCEGHKTDYSPPGFARPPEYDVNQMAGDTYGCRMYWLTQAAVDNSLCPKSTYSSDVCRVDSASTCDICFSEALFGMTGKCSQGYADCLTDKTMGCQTCAGCIDGCKKDPDPQSCITTKCDAPNPAGCAKYTGVLNCLLCDQCDGAKLCAMQNMQIMWV